MYHRRWRFITPAQPAEHTKQNELKIKQTFSFQSPDGSLPSSLCSPTESYADEDLAFMTSISMEDDMDLSMRAPYISMSEADDLPLLISEDLMWGALPCDAPKFVQEPKINVTAEVANMQVVSGANVDFGKAGDYLLSNTKGLDNPGSLLADKGASMVQHGRNSNKRRSPCLTEGEEGTNTNPLASLLLQQVSGGSMGAEQTSITSSSSCSSSDDTNQSDIIDPMFDDSLAKNCECRRSISGE